MQARYPRPSPCWLHALTGLCHQALNRGAGRAAAVRAEDKVRYEKELKEHEAKMEKKKAEKLEKEVWHCAAVR